MKTSMLRRLFVSVLGPLLGSLLLAACAAPIVSREAAGPVTIGIIAINDFHGALEPPNLAVPAPDGKDGHAPVPAGGAAWLASAIVVKMT